jgi:hypothetical protein
VRDGLWEAGEEFVRPLGIEVALRPPFELVRDSLFKRVELLGRETDLKARAGW